MASPSEHKDGLRCDADRDVLVRGTFLPLRVVKALDFGFVAGINRVEECGSLVLEQDRKQGLGMRCYKRGCRKFHPLEVSLRRAAEQNLLSSGQLEAIRKIVNEEKSELHGEAEMTTRDAEMQATDLRKSIILAIIQDVAKLAQLNESDLPDIVNLLVKESIPTRMPTGCGMCGKGRLVPIFQGKIRKDSHTTTEHMVPKLLRACNNCSFIYEDNFNSHVR